MKQFFLKMSCFLLLTGVVQASAFAESPPTAQEVPAKGMVTMVDLGAGTCIPCKMMAPIIEELKTEYKDRATIVFIDVWKMPEQAKKYKVSVIPTQVFFDRNGTEVYRHVGFMEKQAIIDRIEEMMRKK